LLEALKQWRKTQARQEGIALFMVFSNATLTELARRQPRTSDELLDVPGIGQTKQQRYGDAILAILNSPPGTVTSADRYPMNDTVAPHAADEHVLNIGAELAPALGPPTREWPEPDQTRTGAEEAGRGQPVVSPQERSVGLPVNLPADAPSRPFYWTFRLLAAGFSPQECAAIRRLDEEAILDHALQALETGWPLQVEWCLSTELLESLHRLVGKEDSPMIRPLLAQLPPGTRYQEVQLFLLGRR
jgi:hypothetical protein